MARIRERISQAVGTVACPGCGQRVVPVIRKAPGAPDGSPAPTGSQRWSFIWRAPSGVVCPECFFPLERLAQRMKWVHTATFGVILIILGVLIVTVRLMGSEGAWMAVLARAFIWVGVLALLVGAAGVVVGGRSGGASRTP